MNRIVSIAIAVLILFLATTISPYNIHPARASAYIDPVLSRAIATSPSAATVQVVIVLNHNPTTSDTNAIQQYSTTTAPMSQLPMILAVTTYGNLNNIASSPGVVALYANRQLTSYGNVNGASHSFGEIPVQHSWWNDIMSVPAVWSQGFQGQGVTVALVDSGVDASNPSLGYSFPNGLSQATRSISKTSPTQTPPAGTEPAPPG